MSDRIVRPASKLPYSTVGGASMPDSLDYETARVVRCTPTASIYLGLHARGWLARISQGLATSLSSGEMGVSLALARGASGSWRVGGQRACKAYYRTRDSGSSHPQRAAGIPFCDSPAGRNEVSASGRWFLTGLRQSPTKHQRHAVLGARQAAEKSDWPHTSGAPHCKTKLSWQAHARCQAVLSSVSHCSGKTNLEHKQVGLNCLARS